MTDEKFVYSQDLREKKSTARSARYRRTHAGKGGAVKFPSDYMTRKERESMNGEVKTYRLNEPMKWDEYKTMPDDVRTMYIKALRDAYNVSDRTIAAMLGTSQKNFSNETRRLGIGLGRGVGRRSGFKEKEWFAWLNNTPAPVFVDTVEVPAEDEHPVATPVSEKETNADPVPCSGKLEFECPADQALQMVSQILGSRVVNILISWDTVGVNNNG